MKRSITPFLAFVLLLATATAQGEWKWAHYWTGQDGNYSDYHNYITNTAFDDEGNIYVYGALGNNTVMDGEPFEYCSGAQGIPSNAQGILLAKFDTLGNMLWYKVVKQSACAAYPHWMEVKDNSICICGSAGFLGDGSYQWLYFLDTLITKAQILEMPTEQRKPPFKTYSQWTFFAQFDFDGNLLGCHFVEAFPRDFYPDTQMSFPLSGGTDVAPFHSDYDGNTYFFTPIQYGGDEEDPYTLIVDGDTNRTYNLFLPGNTERFMGIKNAMLYKFTPEWTLDFAHLLVDHTDGIATPYEYTQDSVNPLFICYPKGLSYDDEDNMYFSGYITVYPYTIPNGGNLHNYPIHIWWDDTHCHTINNINEAPTSNFIVKYNISGQTEWCNQVHLYTYDSLERPITEFYGNAVCDNLIFVCGNYDSGVHGCPIAYFESDTNNFVNSTSVSQQMKGYIVAFEKNDGHYLFNTIIPDEQFSRFPGNNSSLRVCNNQIVSVGQINQYSNNKLGIARWGNTGEFLSFDPILSYSDLLSKGAGVATDGNGNLAVFMCMQGSMAFSENVYINGSTMYSNAAFAFYHDPELLIPYVKTPDYQKPTLKLRIWPNPASSFISVDCGDMQPKTILLFDENGRELRRISCNNTLTVISLVGLPAGTYLLKAVSSDGTTAIGRFVKAE